uniref:Uncharacterized protein n=1 Tax=Physcomitrium patens TaxID=3218 RepID=A0A7I4B5E3_PHYPA
ARSEPQVHTNGTDSQPPGSSLRLEPGGWARNSSSRDHCRGRVLGFRRPLFGDCAPGYGDAAIVGVIRRLNLCVEVEAGDATVLWHVGFSLGLLYVASCVRAGAVTMDGTLNIAQRTKKVDVDNRLPLKYYHRTAEKLLKQSRIFRDAENTIDYYILLLRFSR